jgi:hypothetical protein
VGGHSLEPAFKFVGTAALDAVVTTMYKLISLAVIIVWTAMFVPSRLYAPRRRPLHEFSAEAERVPALFSLK